MNFPGQIQSFFLLPCNYCHNFLFSTENESHHQNCQIEEAFNTTTGSTKIPYLVLTLKVNNEQPAQSSDIPCTTERNTNGKASLTNMYYSLTTVMLAG